MNKGITDLFSDLSPYEVKFIVDWHRSGKKFTGMSFGYELGKMKKHGFTNTFKITRRASKFKKLSAEEWREVRKLYYPKKED